MSEKINFAGISRRTLNDYMNQLKALEHDITDLGEHIEASYFLVRPPEVRNPESEYSQHGDLTAATWEALQKHVHYLEELKHIVTTRSSIYA